MYVMDKRLSGRFYFDDLMDFAEVYCAQVAQNRSYDFQVFCNTKKCILLINND